jgi:hypothetical protein
MWFANQQLHILPELNSPESYSALPAEMRVKMRTALTDRIELIDSFIAANPCNFNEEELRIVSSWRYQVAGKFFILRYLKSHAIFLVPDEPPVAYGVLALSDTFEELVGSELPIWTETVLLPFRDKIVYDSLLLSYRVSFGSGFRRSLNDSYRAAKERQGIVTSLPAGSGPAARTPSARKKSAGKPKAARTRAEASDSLQVIVGMINHFCHEHLNEEYAQLCRKLVEKLARKRPSPLHSGKPQVWACGIVRTIGWVNFLDDRSQTPHMKLTAIDKAFGVGESTGQGKSKLIRKLFKIRPFDTHWTLPSRMDDNPRVWMVEVNGFFMDIRNCPREVQEIAFEKGLIPYIPADQD